MSNLIFGVQDDEGDTLLQITKNEVRIDADQISVNGMELSAYVLETIFKYLSAPKKQLASDLVSDCETTRRTAQVIYQLQQLVQESR